MHSPVACALAMSEATLRDAATYTYSLAAKCASEIIGTALVICELAWGEPCTWRGRSVYRQGACGRPPSSCNLLPCTFAVVAESTLANELLSKTKVGGRSPHPACELAAAAAAAARPLTAAG